MKSKRQTRLLDPMELRIPPLASDPRMAAIDGEITAILARRLAAEHRLTQAIARLSGASRSRSAVERAKSLLGGAQLSSVSPAAERETAQLEVTSLDALHHDALARRDAIVGEISWEVCQKFRDLHNDAHRSAIAAMSDLWNSLEVTFSLKARLAAAGYSVSSASLPNGFPPAVLALGDPKNRASQAARFRQWCEDRGIA